MHGLVQKLRARRCSGVNSDVAGHFGYVVANNPIPEDDVYPAQEDMAQHGVDHVLDTPDSEAVPDFELQSSGSIHV